MAIVINGNGIDIGNNLVSSVSQIDSEEDIKFTRERGTKTCG